MICTNDEEAAELMSMQRQNGMSKGAWNRYQANGKAHYDIFRGFKISNDGYSSCYRSRPAHSS